MAVRVVDASAVAAVLFGEPEAQTVADRLRGCTLASPVLLPFEVASVCLKKLRRYPEKRAPLLDALQMLGEMRIRQIEVDPVEVVILADQRDVTVYDASYLWLSQRLGVELVTLDRKLAKAAKDR